MIYPPELEEPKVFPRPVIDGVRRPRFVIRTVRDGSVRIYGRDYTPAAQHKAYDGRLDGLRFAFGLYSGRPDLICLWGTEAAYEAAGRDQDYPHGPELVDGGFPWMFWHADEATSPRTQRGMEES